MMSNETTPQEIDLSRVYHWTEIHNNPFVYKPNLFMLLPDGHVMKIRCFLKGQAVKLDVPMTRQVRFDHTFIEAKLKRDFLEPMKVNSLEDLQQRINTAKTE